MYQLMFSVLTSVVVITTRCQAFSSELCEENSHWRAEIAVYINNCIWANSLLFCTVNTYDNVFESTLNLQEPENVTSLMDFHQEIIKYGDILQNLDHQLEAYKTTPAYNQQAAIAQFSRNIAEYKDNLSYLRTEISHTVEHLSAQVTGDRQLAAGTNNPSLLQDLTHIFTETHYVSTKLNLLLRQWVCNCMYCLPARDPSRDCDVTIAMSNDICM